ncbi:MAG: DsrE family protein [Desulfovermiculus sp.]
MAVLFSLLIFSGPGLSQDYPALQNVEDVKAVFDIRSGDPENVVDHLFLVHETFQDKAVRNADSEPEFAVVFMDKSVMLLSQNRESFSPQEREMLKKADQLMTVMAEEGVTLEVCLVALDYYGVEADSIADDINRVKNGWISSIGYQANGYSLVPVY